MSIAHLNVRSGKVRVNMTAIESLFLPSGAVGKHGRRVGQAIKQEAEHTAPSRTGELASSHTGPWYSKTHLGGHCTVGNDAPYALFVHEGTSGPIYPRSHQDLWIRPEPHSWFAYDPQWAEYGGRTPLPSVRGQRGQPWLANAMTGVVRIMHLF